MRRKPGMRWCSPSPAIRRQAFERLRGGVAGATGAGAALPAHRARTAGFPAAGGRAGRGCADDCVDEHVVRGPCPAPSGTLCAVGRHLPAPGVLRVWLAGDWSVLVRHARAHREPCAARSSPVGLFVNLDIERDGSGQFTSPWHVRGAAPSRRRPAPASVARWLRRRAAGR